MADLKVCLTKGGFANVVTLLQSGNVLLDATGTGQSVGATLEKLLEKRFGYDAQVLVYPFAELARIAEANPFGDAGADAQQYVIFAEPTSAKELLAPSSGLDAKIERGRRWKGCVYWTVPQGVDAKVGVRVGISKAKLLNRTTTRNMNTLRKLLALG